MECHPRAQRHRVPDSVPTTQPACHGRKLAPEELEAGTLCSTAGEPILKSQLHATSAPGDICARQSLNARRFVSPNTPVKRTREVACQIFSCCFQGSRERSNTHAKAPAEHPSRMAANIRRCVQNGSHCANMCGKVFVRTQLALYVSAPQCNPKQPTRQRCLAAQERIILTAAAEHKGLVPVDNLQHCCHVPTFYATERCALRQSCQSSTAPAASVACGGPIAPYWLSFASKWRESAHARPYRIL